MAFEIENKITIEAICHEIEDCRKKHKECFMGDGYDDGINSVLLDESRHNYINAVSKYTKQQQEANPEYKKQDAIKEIMAELKKNMPAKIFFDTVFSKGRVMYHFMQTTPEARR